MRLILRPSWALLVVFAAILVNVSTAGRRVSASEAPDFRIVAASQTKSAIGNLTLTKRRHFEVVSKRNQPREKREDDEEEEWDHHDHHEWHTEYHHNWNWEWNWNWNWGHGDDFDKKPLSEQWQEFDKKMEEASKVELKKYMEVKKRHPKEKVERKCSKYQKPCGAEFLPCCKEKEEEKAHRCRHGLDFKEDVSPKTCDSSKSCFCKADGRVGGYSWGFLNCCAIIAVFVVSTMMDV